MLQHTKNTKTRGNTIVNFPILTPFPRQFLRHKFPLRFTTLKYTLSQSVCSIHYTWPIVSNPVSYYPCLFLGGDLVIFDWFVLSMRMQVILESFFYPPEFSPHRGREERRIHGLHDYKKEHTHVKFNIWINLFGSTCRSIRPGLSNRTVKDRLRFIRRTILCAESNAHIRNTLNKLVLTQSGVRYLLLSRSHSLFWSFETKWQEDREDLCSCFKGRKIILAWSA